MKSKDYLYDASTYINKVAQAVNLFELQGSLTQSDINDYKSDALSARDNLNATNQNLISAEDNLKSLLLEVPAQLARVEAARAVLLNNQSKLPKTSITSPISGIVSRQDAKVGQVVSAAGDLVSVISRNLEMEAFIPEVLISGVEVGNTASVTLDAYGEGEKFAATVVHLDPAETIRDGVSTYKVRLAFNNPDERPRPGMTANITVETFRKPDVVLLPERTVVREEEEAFVYILSGSNSREKVPIEIGEKDSQGNVELLSTLPQDAKVIINPSK